ncbi:THAP-type domain-containing protein, partial [Aphis craccivora]
MSTWESDEGSNIYTICLKRLKLKKDGIPVPYINENEVTTDTESYSYNDTSTSTSIESSDLTMNKSIISECSNLLLLNETYSSFSSGTSENQNKQHTIYFIEQPQLLKKEMLVLFYILIDLLNQPGLLEFYQLTTTIHINGKTIKSEIYFQNIKDIETELNLCDKTKCCLGAVSSYDFPDFRQSFGPQYVEYNGQWRHSKCLIVLQDDDSHLNWVQNEIKNIETQQLAQLLGNSSISHGQYQLITELISAATISKYPERLRRHLMAVKIRCGFDEQESLSVNTKNLTYLGLEDLGDDFDNKAELANHALVLMIQSLSESLHQPIA